MSLLDNPKSFEKSYIAANKNESLMHCDICDFKSEKEKQMESHMSEEHDDYYCCYLCAKYFETKQSLKYQNKFIHDEHHNLTESKDEDSSKINNAKINRNVKTHAKKKKGTKK